MIRRRAIDVPCTLDIARTAETVHAHVELDGVAVGHGDEVIVHDAPSWVAPGERLLCRRRATLRRAGAFGRFRARLAGYRGLVELFELGPSGGRAG